MKNLILLISFITLSLFASATVHVVDSLNNSGTGSLRSKVALAVSGDTIRFNPNLIANGSDSIVLTSGEIAFGNKGIVIQGLYTTIDTLFISGNDSSRIFSFSGSGRVVLDSLVMVNAFSSSMGGAIQRDYCSDTLFVLNCVLRANSALRGAGVYSYSNFSPSVVVVKHSKFIGNNSIDYGGGIYSGAPSSPGSSLVSISNSTFSGNIGFRGGGIFSTSISSSVVITNSTLSGNMVPNDGGGVYSSSYSFDTTTIISPRSSVTVTNSIITGNTASGDGAGVYSKVWSSSPYSYTSIPTSSVLVTNSTVSGNIASGYGGGLFSTSTISPSFVAINNSTLSGNSSSFSGGGVYSRSTISSSSSSVTISNSTITGNTATTNGGGVFSSSIDSDSSLITVTGSIIAENGNNISGLYNSSTNTIVSNGFNVFSDSPTGVVVSDSVSIMVAQLNLLPLAFNGGSTQTMLPSLGSVALNNGNPNDTSDAQNSPIIGIRERGAAENCMTSAIDSVISCNNYTWINGVTYTSSNTTANDTLTNAIGCDSIITLNLTIYPAVTGIDTIVACGSYTWIDGGTYYSNNTTATHTLSNTNGCDSIVTLDLTINQPSASSDVITACDSLTWLDGITYVSNNNTASFTATNMNGCDSVITLALTINNSIQTTELVTACNAYTWVNGTTYTVSNNTAIDTLQTVNGCDSIVSLDLTINYSTTATDTHVVCDSLVWIDGVTYTANNTTATHNMVGGSTNGCDSLVTLNLTVNSNSSQYIITACDSLIWIDGITYTSNNFTATHVLTNALGCDSVVNLELTILNSSQSTHSVSSCGSYTWNGVTYTSNNTTATQTLTNVLGCDSVVTLDLTILQSSTGTAVVSACNSYTWNGNTYTANNNTALDTLINAAGCDSIVTLDLTILSSTSSIETVTVCDFYVFNGITYTSSNNTAQDTLVNTGGCDSIITLNLTILNSSQFTDVISSCNPITWLDGNTYSANNTTATHVLINSVGCDSVVTLDFTILQSTSAIDVITSCTEITWIDGMVYNQTTNSPTFTIPNSNGCDSVVTLDLTILEVDTTVTRNYLTLTAQATNATYQWIDCNNGAMTGETNASFTATVNGNYQVAVTQNGCVDTSACFTIANVGVQDIELIGVKLYPNPTSDVLNIDKGSNTSLEITITNSVGAVVYQSNTQNQITTINMAKMAMGMYVLTLKNELGMKVEKVVKR